VWVILSQVERYADWAPWIRVARHVDGRSGLGMAYEERSRLLTPLAATSRWRVIEFDRPRRQVHRAEEVALAATFERIFELASDGAGGTWLTVAVRYRPGLGVLGRLLDRLVLRAVLARRLGPALERIDRLAERPRPTVVP
jgi:hypothetical protein